MAHDRFNANDAPRSTWLTSIRAALNTADKAAASMAREQEVSIAAQALLHRLASIRAEVDYLEQGWSRRVTRPAADRPLRQIRS